MYQYHFSRFENVKKRKLDFFLLKINLEILRNLQLCLFVSLADRFIAVDIVT